MNTFISLMLFAFIFILSTKFGTIYENIVLQSTLHKHIKSAITWLIWELIMWSDCIYMMYALQKFSSYEFHVKEKNVLWKFNWIFFLFFMQTSHIWQCQHILNNDHIFLIELKSAESIIMCISMYIITRNIYMLLPSYLLLKRYIPKF